MQAANGTRRATVLFLCTGNYYRSRHAEEVFNHLAAEAGLAWGATSRGLALEFGVNNVGPMSRAARARLTALGIPHGPDPRMPLPVTELDLTGAELVVALKELEHRPLLAERFPAWADRVEYWAVHDVDFAAPDVALPEIEGHVRALVARLATGPGTGSERTGP
jgi:protein-tyrosine phosphatase